MPDHLDTWTGADFLSYERYIDSTTGLEQLTRVATINEEWVVGDWDGEIYSVRFDKNFSKKHLATFSKNREWTEREAYYAWERSGKSRGAGENWQHAEHQLMYQKMDTTVQNRSVAGTCVCGHRFNRHPGGGQCNYPGCTGHPARPGHPPSLAPCPQFTTSFAAARIEQGKPTVDPLAGAPTSRNTFIVLNWVPKGEFESVIVQSIQAHEKPAATLSTPTWKRGDPLAKSVGDEVALKWDFGASRLGAIVQAQLSTPPSSWGKKQGCYVKAKKIATDWGRQTWQIFHMESSGTHAAF